MRLKELEILNHKRWSVKSFNKWIKSTKWFWWLQRFDTLSIIRSILHWETLHCIDDVWQINPPPDYLPIMGDVEQGNIWENCKELTIPRSDQCSFLLNFSQPPQKAINKKTSIWNPPASRMSKNQCIKVSTLGELFMTSAKLHLAV